MANEDANVVISADVSQYQTSVNQATQQTNQFAESVDKLSAKLDGITKRAGKKLMLFGAADLAAMTGMLAIAAKYDKQMSSLNASIATTTKRSKDYSTAVNQIARDMPVARAEVAALVTQLEKQAQASAQSAEAMSRTFIKLGSATSENASTLAASMVQLNKQMNTMASGSGAVAGFSNSLVAVSKAAGVSSQGVLDFAQNLAPFARTAGIGEKALIGISSAFNAAGADGFAAATAFNSVVADITRSIQNGSPDITKYSNLIGVTVEQFKSMDATDRITRIFEVIAKQGPNAIRTLDMLGQDGIRASKAIQAVTQSGDMRGMINKAVSGYDNSDPLEQSSKAGMSGLTDTLEKTRENVMQIGQAIGSGLVTPATQALEVFNKILSVTNAIAAPILAIGGVISTTLGGAALGGGAAGSMLGTFGQIALAGYALRSRPARALLGGLQTGFQSQNAAPLTGLAANQSRLFAAGEMPRYASPFFSVGRGIGQAVAGPMAAGPNYFGRALTAPIRLLGWGAMASAQFYDDSRLNGEDRPRAWQQRAMANTRVQGADRAEQRSIRTLGRQLDEDVAAGRINAQAAKALMDSRVKLARANVTAAATTDQLTATTKQAIGAMGRAAAANLRAGTSNIASLGGSALGAIGSFIGPQMAVLMAGFAGYSAISGAQRARTTPVADAAMNPISEYNAALGLSTNKLTDLNQAITKTAKSYDTVSAALGDMTTAVKRAAADAKYTSSIVANLSESDQSQGLAFLRSVSGQLTPENSNQVLSDLVRKYGQQGANQIVGQFSANQNYGNADLNSTLAAAQGSNYQGWLGKLTDYMSQGGISDEAMLMSGDLVGSIASASAGAAQTDQFRGQQVQASLLGSSLVNVVQQIAQGKLSDSVATQTISGLEQNYFGGDIGFSGDSDTMGLTTGWAPSVARYVNKDMADITEEDIQKWFIEKAIPDNPQLEKWYETQKELGLDPFMAVSKAYTVSRPASDPVVQRINATGLGGFAKGNEQIQYALDEGFGSPSAQQKSVIALLNEGMRQGGGDSSKTILAFNELITAIDLSSDRLSQLGQAAWDAYSALSNLRRGNMSQSAGTTEVLMDTTALINAPTSDANSDAQNSARTQRAEALASVRDYYKQYAQALYQFNVQTTRANEDYTRSRRRAQESFQRQSMYAEKDYYRQRAWNQADFNKSMRRAAEEAAKSVYNPWERVYSQLTTGAGDLVTNMREQNELLNQQIQNVQTVKNAGLSQQVIDQLDLTNPQNAQQLQALVEDIAQNPEYVKQLNAAAKSRGRLVTTLTQNESNASYRNALEDFKTNLARSDALFNESQRRSAEQFGISMAQMAEDHATTMDRATEDMNNYGKVIADNFSEAEKYINKMMEDLGVSNKFVTDMAKVFAENPDFAKWINNGTYGLTDPGTGGTAGSGNNTTSRLPGTNRPVPVDVGPANTGPMSVQASSSVVGTSGLPSYMTNNTSTTNTQSTTTTNSNNKTTHYNYTTEYIIDKPTVVAADPKQIARELAAAARQTALTRGGKPLPINV